MQKKRPNLTDPQLFFVFSLKPEIQRFGRLRFPRVAEAFFDHRNVVKVVAEAQASTLRRNSSGCFFANPGIQDYCDSVTLRLLPE